MRWRTRRPVVGRADTCHPATWPLDVDGRVEHPSSISLRELRAMPSHTVVATLECAGNGRKQFEPAVAGEPWQLGAVSTAEWTASGCPTCSTEPATAAGGDRGRDAGRRRRVGRRKGKRRWRSAQPGARRARRPDVVLAYAMNGERAAARTRPAGTDDRAGPVRGGVGQVAARPHSRRHLFAGYFQSARYVYEWERDGRLMTEPVGRQRVARPDHRTRRGRRHRSRRRHGARRRMVGDGADRGRRCACRERTVGGGPDGRRRPADTAGSGRSASSASPRPDRPRCGPAQPTRQAGHSPIGSEWTPPRLRQQRDPGRRRRRPVSAGPRGAGYQA